MRLNTLTVLAGESIQFFQYAGTNQNWQGEVRSKYYIQLPDGKYGRIDFYFLPYNGVFTVYSAINPDGSQSLEPK